MAMKKIMVSMTEEMVKALEQERKVRKIATVPEVVRIIVSDYFKMKSGN
ncbi:MAG: hypothetical protein KGI26_04335 [Thaumarchaeota archaeon]|nr:hypothetical protein [Nitrososphaerota archaeon]